MMIMTAFGSLKEAQELIHEHLYRLDPVGERGFEGFMASALSELTGCAFHVAKSGHQDGSDVRSEPHNLFKIGLEGKQYKPSTSLSLDALLHKITAASSARVPVDLWLLATTRRIDASDREKLHKYGETVGIGIVVLDWPDDMGQLCDLTVICASATDTCNTFFESQPPTEALKLIRRDSSFERMRSEILDRLTQPDVGYDSARLSCERWMVEAQDSLENAKSRLGGHHNLRKSEYGVIPRVEINVQLDEWYSGSHGIAALLGDEGTGKSWAALDWYNALRSSGDGAPLTVFLKAKTIDASDVKSTLANALAAQTGLGSPTFWEKRLALWERSRGRVQILVLVDGLNENFKFTEWADWFQPLFEDNLSGMYRIVVSCWPNWWNGSLAGLTNLTPQPQEIMIGRFNDFELNALLAAMDVNRSDFAGGVLELMRVPRLSSLVARYRQKLQKSGDVTPERVIYEDWKDRRQRRGSKTGLTDPEMKAFVADLGSKLKKDINQAVTRRDVIDNLSDESGKDGLELQPAVTELTSGAWLKPGDNPHTFRVAADRIPFVLGAALMSEIRKERDAAAIEAIIAEFLDPLKAHSLGAAILRAATTIALIEADSSPELRQTLLSNWLDQQNFHVNDFESFWRLAGLDPNLFVDLAETRWLARSGRFLSDEVLIKTLANASVYRDFEKNLRERLTSWLATAWPDPKVGTVLGEVDQTQQDSRLRAAETRANYAEWSASGPADDFTKISLDNKEGWPWLSQRALAVLSYLQRAPFAVVLESWALSRSIMRCAQHSDNVAWLLRLNSEDAHETSEAIHSVIARFKATDHSTSHRAAAYLELAISHVERANTPLVIDQHPIETAMPSDVSGMDTSALYDAAREHLSPSGWKTRDPKNSTALINAVIERGLRENDGALNLLVDHLSDVLIILTQDSRILLRDAISAKLNAIKDPDGEGKVTAGKFKSALLTLRLYDAEPREQSALVLSYGLDGDLDSWLPFLRPITGNEITKPSLNDAPVRHVADWLTYVGERLPKEDIAKLDFLSDLITHADDDVRHGALVLAAHGCNMPALRVFATSSHSSPPPGGDRPNLLHEYWRHRGLLEFYGFVPQAPVSELMSPEHVALIANHRPTDHTVLDHFNEYLRSEFEAMRSGQSWSRPRYWCRYRKAVRGLVEYDLHAILNWLEPWLDNPVGAECALMNEFPVIETMRALSVKAPQTSLKLYEFLTDRSQGGIFSTDGILYYPLEVPESQDAGVLCDKLLEEARTDKSLLEIACAAYKNERVGWLLDQVNRLERSSTPADVAKAYTLLGFCDKDHRADTVWQAFLSRPPLDQWLNGVMRSSAKAYVRNSEAREALTGFWSNRDMGLARHALKRVEETCDLRIGIWFEHLCPDWDDQQYPHRVAMSLATTNLNQATRKDRDSRKKQLFHTPIPHGTMAPWR